MCVKMIGGFVLLVALAAFGVGCSGDKDKGVNSNREKPKAEREMGPVAKPVS